VNYGFFPDDLKLMRGGSRSQAGVRRLRDDLKLVGPEERKESSIIVAGSSMAPTGRKGILKSGGETTGGRVRDQESVPGRGVCSWLCS
jgi:hypothetical protein